MAGPLIKQLGFEICTGKLHVNGQPSQVPLTVRVNVPEVPAVTLTVEPVADPTIVPPAETLQVCVSAPTQPVTLTL